MADEREPDTGFQRRSSDHSPTAEERLHSDVARLVDLAPIRDSMMQNARAVQVVGERVDSMRDELSGYVIQHAQLHSDDAKTVAAKWEGVAAELAYRRGLIGFPRLILEWMRQYLPTLGVLGALISLIVGFATGNVDVSVGPSQ